MINQISLSGWWQFKFDDVNIGLEKGWASNPPDDCLQINLPSCWNEVFPHYATYDGTAWYFREVRLQSENPDQRMTLCFEGVNYRCEVFINGQKVGQHEGGFTHFSFDITHAIRGDALNLLAIRVNAQLDEWTLPPSGVDWFNYGGIYRPVYMEVTRSSFIDDVTIKTRMDGSVSLDTSIISTRETGRHQLIIMINDQTGLPVIEQTIALDLTAATALHAKTELKIPDPHLWNLGAAYLYHLHLKLVDTEGTVCDLFEKRFGIRELRIVGQSITINGEIVQLVGCSKHDEYPMTGRATSREQLIKDYDLLRQMNVTFVRLAHYPHSRLEHEILDELGMVAMSEIPMVFLREPQMTNSTTLEKTKHMLAEMIKTEKNSTCVVMWSLLIECETDVPANRPFVKAIVDLTHELDDTRFAVMASNRPLTDVTYEYFDVIGVNYWRGWYGGDTVQDGEDFLMKMAERYPDKPMLITSHGWEGLYGVRSYEAKTPWSEDLQTDYLTQIADVYMRFKNIVGEIIWTFADFRVSNWQDISEPGMNPTYLGRPEMVNHKGVVDFFRRPKSTYYAMKDKFELWQERSTHPLGTYGENLSVYVYSNRRVAGNVAAFDFIDVINAVLETKETANVIFATGASQLQFFEALLINRMFVDWNRIDAFHLDEYVGIGLDNKSGFVRFLKDRIMDVLPLRQFHALNGMAADLEAECQRYTGLLSENEIDLACIGIGENGHLAFNDPPVADFSDPHLVKVVDLDEACREQQFRERAFPTVESVPRQALTLTIPAVMRAKTIHCIAPGAVKEIPIWKTLHAEISTKCPATILRRHPKAKLYLDKASAALFYPGR